MCYWFVGIFREVVIVRIFGPWALCAASIIGWGFKREGHTTLIDGSLCILGAD